MLSQKLPQSERSFGRCHTYGVQYYSTCGFPPSARLPLLPPNTKTFQSGTANTPTAEWFHLGHQYVVYEEGCTTPKEREGGGYGYGEQARFVNFGRRRWLEVGWCTGTSANCNRICSDCTTVRGCWWSQAHGACYDSECTYIFLRLFISGAQYLTRTLT